ncbi:unnamed protein product [Trichobilharzia regenti]|nr:unnamed protein product [Trichobilharzia regenti]
MHESAAHCLIELITVLRNYLINNPLNTTDGVNFSLGPNNATNGGDGGSSDDLSAADSTTPKTTNNPNYLNTTQSTSSISGFPVNNSSISHLLDDYIDDDDATYKAAENLLNILER